VYFLPSDRHSGDGSACIGPGVDDVVVRAVAGLGVGDGGVCSSGWEGTDVLVGMGGLAGLVGSSGKGVSCWLGVIKVVQVAVEKGFINGSP